MAGLGGISPITVSLIAQTGVIAALRPGQVAQGTIQTSERGLLLRIGGSEIPIEPVAGLSPGLRVSVELVHTNQGPQLRLTPQQARAQGAGQGAGSASTSAATAASGAAADSVTASGVPLSRGPAGELLSTFGTTSQRGQSAETLAAEGTPQSPRGAGESPPLPSPAPAAAQNRGASPEQTAASIRTPTTFTAPLVAEVAPELPEVLTQVLKSFAQLDAVREAVHLLPKALPRTEHAIRLILSMHFSRGAVGKDLAVVASMLGQAADAGVLSEAEFSTLSSVVRMAGAAPEDDLELLVRRAVSQSGRSLESRLATAIAAGNVEAFLEELKGDLVVQLSRLRANEHLASHLRKTGRFADFQSAIERTLERLSGGQLQNLRAFELPYYFLELPLDPQSPITHAQIHFFGEENERGREFNKENATVVFDLSTTRLGDLWISMGPVQGICHCWIRATDAEVVRLVDDTATELAQRLESCGYAGAQVHATLWDGNRLRETANLMRRFEGISLQA
ncbi:MAG: hypothetical protein IT365_00915 [Candidatus Hydrogenedentes bacterium]|nr:hypothetical protein [Candidatus Hydrogenedentota bacterium]